MISRPPTTRTAFTLIELLIVIMIIALLASITLFTLQGVQENARDARTRAQIGRLHELIMVKWEEYQSRPMPIKVAPGTNPAVAAQLRVDAVRALMRLEFPDRKSDVSIPNPSPPPARVPAVRDMPALAWPALSRQYWRKATSTWTEEHESAECLYLIISAMNDGDSSALEFFSENEIGDVDGDGMPEILDAWGNPIRFLRWAPGFGADFSPTLPFYASPLQPVSDRDPNNPDVSDPFDPLRVYGKNYPLYPLIYSAGPDEAYGITAVAPPIAPDSEFVYSRTSPPNNPYYAPALPDFPLGTPVPDADGNLTFADNIHNHMRDVR